MMHLEDGEEPPERCIPPDFNPAWGVYRRAFDALTYDRPPAISGVAHIPTAVIIAHAKEMDGVSGKEDLRFYRRMVRAIDREWVRAAQDLKPKKKAAE
ncbi:hypothetical protein [Nisaea sediminum]|uniref:hypothetical protein n=1 Tax=Nisaea sediminum TaxID=2775867 RepID=UPI001D013B72|nr:hypothetical protein [Nisaea sediminum]